ncbi:MAG TPA: hypothetical protein VGP24_07435 [Glaciihabitans sp.]|jgi:hypothetical protein|nr:hypothetical protein [Glaciihabitans sp.]
MNETSMQADDTAALADHLHEVEGLPLDQRAAGYVSLHNQLQTTLEGGDVVSSHG